VERWPNSAGNGEFSDYCILIGYTKTFPRHDGDYIAYRWAGSPAGLIPRLLPIGRMRSMLRKPVPGYKGGLTTRIVAAGGLPPAYNVPTAVMNNSGSSHRNQANIHIKFFQSLSGSVKESNLRCSKKVPFFAVGPGCLRTSCFADGLGAAWARG
jgi:hypothetical protein